MTTQNCCARALIRIWPATQGKLTNLAFLHNVEWHKDNVAFLCEVAQIVVCGRKPNVEAFTKDFKAKWVMYE